MENSYGVGVVNRYALFLDDESDPLDAIKASEQAKELKKKTKDAEKENKGKPEVKPKGPTAPARKGIKETQNVKTTPDIKSGEQQKPKGPARPPVDRNNAERPPPRRPREDRPQNGAVDNKDGAPRPPRRDFVERGGERRPNFERRNFDNPEGGERRGPRPPREPRGDRDPREPRGDRDPREPRGDRDPRDAREGRDPRDAREGPRGPRPPYDNRGKREFDRRSGSDKTGVKPVDKREGGGPHNWGTIKDDIDELNKTGSEGEPAEDKPAAEGAGAGAGAGDGVAPELQQPAVPAEDEPRELTLDEYKALRNAQRTQPQYNLRKAGEGEDLTQWKKLVPLEKKKEPTGEEGEDTDDEYDLADYPQRVGRQKRVLGIEFTFNDMSRRGAPGGRGRGRGGRGARGGRGGPPRDEPPPVEERPQPRQSAPPKVDDSKDFPSLG